MKKLALLVSILLASTYAVAQASKIIEGRIYPKNSSGALFTPGSVPYTGTGGAVSQDNANLFWDSLNFRLGIGTAAPSAPLHVKANADALQARITANSSQTADLLRVENSAGTTPYMTIGPDGDVRLAENGGSGFFWDASTHRLSINSGASPFTDLQVDGGGWFSGLVYINRIDAGVGGPSLYSSGVGEYMALRTNGGNERVRILSTGEVGIGTSTPAYLLDVNGTALLDALKLEDVGGYPLLINGTAGTGIYRDSGANKLGFLVNSAGLVIDSVGYGRFTSGLEVDQDVLLKNSSGAQPKFALSEDPDNGTNKTVIQAAAALAADYTLTLPVDDGTNGQVLSTDGSGVLGWANASTTPITAGSVYSDGSTMAATAWAANANKVLGVTAAATGQEFKTLAVGTSGSDFAVAHSAGTITFNLPSASLTARGAVDDGPQAFDGVKTFDDAPVVTAFGKGIVESSSSGALVSTNVWTSSVTAQPSVTDPATLVRHYGGAFSSIAYVSGVGGSYEVAFTSSFWSSPPNCNINMIALNPGDLAYVSITDNMTASGFRFQVKTTGGTLTSSPGFTITCQGER